MPPEPEPLVHHTSYLYFQTTAAYVYGVSIVHTGMGGMAWHLAAEQ